jgi:hypothetical protein
MQERRHGHVPAARRAPQAGSRDGGGGRHAVPVVPVAGRAPQAGGRARGGLRAVLVVPAGGDVALLHPARFLPTTVASSTVRSVILLLTTVATCEGDANARAWSHGDDHALLHYFPGDVA